MSTARLNTKVALRVELSLTFKLNQSFMAIKNPEEIYEEIISIQKQHPKDHIRIIKNKEDGDNFLKKFDYYIRTGKFSNYSFSDSEVIGLVNSMIKIYYRVLIIIDVDAKIYTVYIPRGEGRK